jgi:hypothetical protein
MYNDEESDNDNTITQNEINWYTGWEIRKSTLQMG